MNLRVPLEKKEILRINGQKCTRQVDTLAKEEPLEIQLTHPLWTEPYSLVITMRTPGDDEDLIIGYLFTEGLIEGVDDVLHFTYPQNSVILVHLSSKVSFDPTVIRRNAISNSGCGVCGKSSLNFLVSSSRFRPGPRQPVIHQNILRCLVPALEQEQQYFKSSGGMHAAALFDSKGRLLLTREDIGRHNAVDKLIGAGLRLGLTLPWEETLCLVSGRAGFELIQKVCMTGLSVFVAVGAPSSLAVQWAEQHDLTLIGFLKDDRFNIYSSPERIELHGWSFH